MGLQAAYSPQADFSNIFSNGGQGHLSSVIQKAVFEISEEGTLVTTTRNASSPKATVQVRANYPFFFAVLDKSFDVVLLGKFTV